MGNTFHHESTNVTSKGNFKMELCRRGLYLALIISILAVDTPVNFERFVFSTQQYYSTSLRQANIFCSLSDNLGS